MYDIISYLIDVFDRGHFKYVFKYNINSNKGLVLLFYYLLDRTDQENIKYGILYINMLWSKLFQYFYIIFLFNLSTILDFFFLRLTLDIVIQIQNRTLKGEGEKGNRRSKRDWTGRQEGGRSVVRETKGGEDQKTNHKEPQHRKNDGKDGGAGVDVGRVQISPATRPGRGETRDARQR